MRQKRSRSWSWHLLVLSLLLLMPPANTLAAPNMEVLLPPTSCGIGWKMAGKPLFYDRENLSERINGEAELYFPYGFDRMAAARYVDEKNPAIGMDVEIYRMGSMLDAFGIFANYRHKDGSSLDIGAEASLSGTQLFLYQGPMFVHIQLTGAATIDPDVLAKCGRTVTSRLPGTKNRPSALAPFDLPEIVKGTERYLPQSLLGYDFLNRGILTEATLEGASLQVFLLLDTSTDSAAVAFDRFRSQLTFANTGTTSNNLVFLEGIDPLYGPVIIMRKGNCITGALKFTREKGIHSLLKSICSK
jgi:hypothetical protein